MVIRRKVGDVVIEVTLTPDELSAAYFEKQALFDKEDCQSHFENNYCEEEWWPVSKDTRECIVERAAWIMRKNIDKYDMSFEYAIADAFACAIPEFILPKGE